MYQIEALNGAGGWVLLDGELQGSDDDLVVYLVARSTDGECLKVSLPVTFKGRLRELIHLPVTAETLWLEPALEDGRLQVISLSARRVSAFKAHLVMLRRVLNYYRRLSSVERRRLGLRWHSWLTDLPDTYRSVGRTRAFGPPPDYQAWIASTEWYRALPGRQVGKLASRLGVSGTVLLDGRITCGDPSGRTSASIASQVGMKPGVLTLTGGGQDAAVIAQLVSLPEGSVVMRVEPGVVLAPWAMVWMAAQARESSELVWYSDHDSLSSEGVRYSPVFKPDWSPELAEVTGYFGRVVAFRITAETRKIIEAMPADAYDLMMALARLAGQQEVGHIPAVLWHATEGDGYARPGFAQVSEQVAAEHARVEVDTRGYPRVFCPVPDPLPKVSIIVPTRNMFGLLKSCIDSVLAQTTWPDFEILILDNQSDCPDTLAYMREASASSRVRVLRYDHPFNFSAINNFAARHASGQVLCLLNNDTEVISPDWLDEMVSRLSRPGVGVVGARLLFSDGRLQHGGDVLGPGGCATHLHGIIDGSDPGYMDRAMLPQDLSAVTAACLVTPKALFDELGGLDEANLPVAFNDVDYCLRVREAGYRVVYTPYAELYHHESVSRGTDDSPEKKKRAQRETSYMRKRWAEVIERDPFYNPNLNYSKADFRLGRYPRVEPPF